MAPKKKIISIVGITALAIIPAIIFVTPKYLHTSGADTTDTVAPSAAENTTGNSPLAVQNAPSPSTNQPTKTVTKTDVLNAQVGTPLSVINGTIRPQEYSGIILDPGEHADRSVSGKKSVWAYVSPVVKAANSMTPKLDTECRLNPASESTICPYIYTQASDDLQNWQLFSTAPNTSPPRGGKISYGSSAYYSGAKYYRFVLYSQQCEGAVCREGSALIGSYAYKLSVTFK